MPTTNLQPQTVTNPDQGGTLAVTSASTTGHGSTVTSAAAIAAVTTVTDSEDKSCRWSAFQSAPFGAITSLRLQFTWSASGNAIANANVNGAASGFASFAVQYTLNGGSNWITHASDSAAVSGNSTDPLSSSGSADIPLSTAQTVSQVQVRVRTDTDATATPGDLGASDASASVTSSVSGIQLQVVTPDVAQLVVMM